MSSQSKLQVGKKMRAFISVGALFFTLLFSHFASAFELVLTCHIPEQVNDTYRYRERSSTFTINDRTIKEGFYIVTEDKIHGTVGNFIIDRRTGQITIDTTTGTDTGRFLVYGTCQPAGSKKKF